MYMLIKKYNNVYRKKHKAVASLAGCGTSGQRQEEEMEDDSGGSEVQRASASSLLRKNLPPLQRLVSQQLQIWVSGFLLDTRVNMVPIHPVIHARELGAAASASSTLECTSFVGAVPNPLDLDSVLSLLPSAPFSSQLPVLVQQCLL